MPTVVIKVCTGHVTGIAILLTGTRKLEEVISQSPHDLNWLRESKFALSLRVTQQVKQTVNRVAGGFKTWTLVLYFQ